MKRSQPLRKEKWRLVGGNSATLGVSLTILPGSISLNVFLILYLLYWHIVLMPVFLVIAVCIKLEDGGTSSISEK